MAQKQKKRTTGNNMTHHAKCIMILKSYFKNEIFKHALKTKSFPPLPTVYSQSLP